MFERPQTGETAVLVHIHFPTGQASEDLTEFHELVRSAGVTPLDHLEARRRSPDPRYFVGRGKAEELRERVHACGGELVLFNHGLSPSQERNLESLLGCRVLDRTGLILDIFAQRARSHDGKLQVELAQLKHLSTRLVRGWTHLERQKGGIGLRGPGETQLETDRRLLGERIKQIQRQLQKVRGQREQGRQARHKVPVPTVSLVGYTNAGKSTLFSGLTESPVYVADQLFATLDPTLRRFQVGPSEEAILADTVGFIRHLPHDLVAAFRATLQETREARLLLHVVDAADPRRDENMEAVEGVLQAIGADHVPRLEVFNKIDRMEQAPRVDRDARGQPQRVWVSATSGAGRHELGSAIAECLYPDRQQWWLRLPPDAGRVRAALYADSTVLEEHHDASGQAWLCVTMTPHRRARLEKDLSFDLAAYVADPAIEPEPASSCHHGGRSLESIG